MHFQDLFTTTHVRQTNHDLTVETAWAQQRRVKHVRTVSRRDDDNAFVAFKTIHLNEHLVQGLLTFIVTATKTGATLATHGIDFIDKDDARRRFFSLFEHVANTGRAHTHEHFYEVGTGDGKERHFRLARDSFRQQGFTGTRRADHQDALRNFTAQLLETARLAQVFHQLADFLFRFVAACHVSESGFDLIFRQHARLAFAERHGAFATAALHLAHKEYPDPNQQQHREPGDEDSGQQALLFRRFADNFYVFGQQVIKEFGIVYGNISRVSVTIFLGNVNFTSIDTRFANLVLVNFLQEGRVIHPTATRLAGPKALEY
ncbi:hypothetical protein BN132_2987 [Cronobacter turicensis 564]|nr:hypothetical protein BN132_2987 [Cronobacter turicensis 564]